MAGHGGEDRARRRLATRAEALGVPPPPAPVEIKFLGGRGDGLTALVRWTGGDGVAVQRWATAWQPEGVHVARGRVLLVRLAGPPAAWNGFPEGVRVQHVRLFPGGGAQVHVEGPAAAVAAFAGGMRDGRPARQGRPALTRRQAEAVEAAAALGYYRIPRPVTLEDVAARLGISVASASELLRRAENSILLAHVARAAGPPAEGV